MTDEELWIAQIEDVIKWADEICGEWNGDESGSQENRANQAEDIVNKALDLQELIKGMSEL